MGWGSSVRRQQKTWPTASQQAGQASTRTPPASGSDIREGPDGSVSGHPPVFPPFPSRFRAQAHLAMLRHTLFLPCAHSPHVCALSPEPFFVFPASSGKSCLTASLGTWLRLSESPFGQPSLPTLSCLCSLASRPSGPGLVCHLSLFHPDLGSRCWALFPSSAPESWVPFSAGFPGPRSRAGLTRLASASWRTSKKWKRSERARTELCTKPKTS